MTRKKNISLLIRVRQAIAYQFEKLKARTESNLCEIMMPCPYLPTDQTAELELASQVKLELLFVRALAVSL